MWGDVRYLHRYCLNRNMAQRSELYVIILTTITSTFLEMEIHGFTTRSQKNN